MAGNALKLDPELWQALKIYAIRKGVTVRSVLERLIKAELGIGA